jgi:hypothetical protein
VSAATPPRLSPAYRLLLAQHILAMCSQNTYEHVEDFEWLLSVLVDLVYVAKADIGAQIRDTFIDVVGRVRGARRYAVTLSVKLLSDSSLILSINEEIACLEALWAAAWVAGEYCRLVQPCFPSTAPSLVSVASWQSHRRCCLTFSTLISLNSLRRPSPSTCTVRPRSSLSGPSNWRSAGMTTSFPTSRVSWTRQWRVYNLSS